MYQINTHKCCTANISVNRNRVKQYFDTVYLNNSQSFEIELFNPKAISVLAKISINGTLISSSGIVLRPGQRVFLERFIDSPKKFKFETYEIEDSAEAKAAIVKNGEVKVEFFNERLVSYSADYVYATPPCYYNQPSITPLTGTWITTNSPASTFNLAGSTITSGSAYFSNTNSFNQCSQPVAGSIETGRIEPGLKSDQKFEQHLGNFNWLADETVIVYIKPGSAKPVEAGEIRNYCTSCRTRIKKSSWRFCPSCGTQIDE